MFLCRCLPLLQSEVYGLPALVPLLLNNVLSDTDVTLSHSAG